MNNNTNSARARRQQPTTGYGPWATRYDFPPPEAIRIDLPNDYVVVDAEGGGGTVEITKEMKLLATPGALLLLLLLLLLLYRLRVACACV